MPYSLLDPFAFPSGHAARTAAVVAVVLASGCWWASLAAAAWALAVAWARLRLELHDRVDIAGGWLVGLLVGSLV